MTRTRLVASIIVLTDRVHVRATLILLIMVLFVHFKFKKAEYTYHVVVGDVEVIRKVNLKKIYPSSMQYYFRTSSS